MVPSNSMPYETQAQVQTITNKQELVQFIQSKGANPGLCNLIERLPESSANAQR